MAFSRKEWVFLPPPPEGFLAGVGVPPVVASALYHRGVTTPHRLEAFLALGPERLYNPFLLSGMERAVKRLERAREEGETVALFGDFDVDGVTGTALLARALAELGIATIPYIPHRVEEGHGLTIRAVEQLRRKGASLLVTVDCGITSLEEVAHARNLGMDVIVTDHHTPPAQLPAALAIVSPKLVEEAYPFQELAGAGLALKLAQGLCQRLGKGLAPDLLGLAALGTIADVAPLVDENRTIAALGLRALRQSRQPGLLALSQQASFDPSALDVEAVAFVIAPRLNAAGRLDHALTSYRLLTTSDPLEAQDLAANLERLNRERQRLCDDAWAWAREEVLSRAELPHLLMVGREGLAPGVSGLVASKLCEEFYRPAVVMALEQSVVRGSVRSVPEFNAIGALRTCSDLFLRFGGHPQAAGFIMPRERLPVLEQRLSAVAAELLADIPLRPTLTIDAETPVRALVGESFRWLQALEPCGAGNPPPVFVSRGLEVLEVRPMGDRSEHVRMKLRENGAVWDAVAFRQGSLGVPGGEMPGRVDVAYTVDARKWAGQQALRLKVLDMRPWAG